MLFVIAVASLGCELTAPQESESNAEITNQNVQSNSPIGNSLYYLSNENGTFQVWKLHLDSNTATQLTNSPEDITDYSVSELGGSIAFITDNKLYLYNPNTSYTEIIFDGGYIDFNNQIDIFTSTINGLAWSRSDNILAYGYNGLNLFDGDENSHSQILSNQIISDTNAGATPQAIYRPISWSPNGSQILMNIESSEGWEIASYHIDSTTIVKMGAPFVCCTMTWLDDNQSILTSNPYVGLTFPGLWHYNTKTGQETTMVPTTSKEGTLNFVGWPIDMANGSLRYFYTNTAAYPEISPPLIMVESPFSALENPTPIRPETWPIIDALWAKDGSFAIIVQTPLGETITPYSGPILLIDTEGSSPIPLVTNGYNLQWGP